jgi:hypothetical protein
MIIKWNRVYVNISIHFDHLTKVERDRDEERTLLNQKVTSLEEQYQILQRKSLDKEES